MSPAAVTYGALGVAIVFEVIATSLLQQSQQFTRLLPSVLTVVAYVIAFYFLSISLTSLPVGIAYAIWSGMGIVLISLIGLVFLGQRLDLPAVVGLGLIIAGVVVVNLFSKSVPH